MRRLLRDEAAARDRFDHVYRTTRAALLAYLVRRTETPEDAADLLGEVYLVAWRRIADVPAGEQARLWLFGVARRVLANHRRRVRTQTELAAALERTLQTHDAEQPRLAADDSAAVGEVLASLSAADRELLMLRHWEELKPAEIAVVLGRPAAVIRVRLHRARRRAEAKFLEATHEAPLLDRRGRLIEPAAAE